MAAYHCSAEERNREEPASVIFHPPWQQSGTPERGSCNVVGVGSILCHGWTNRAEAGTSFQVKDLHALTNGLDNGLL